MFDTYVTREEHSHHHHRHDVRVQEHRAPTDASVALLKEMEAAAQAKLLASARVENTPIDCVVHEFMDSMGMFRRFFIRAQVNGQPMQVEVKVDALRDAHKPASDRRDEICVTLVNALAQQISAQILAKAFKATPGLLSDLRRAAA